jgi:hypothetical protein
LRLDVGLPIHRRFELRDPATMGQRSGTETVAAVMATLLARQPGPDRRGRAA